MSIESIMFGTKDTDIIHEYILTDDPVELLVVAPFVIFQHSIHVSDDVTKKWEAFLHILKQSMASSGILVSNCVNAAVLNANTYIASLKEYEISDFLNTIKDFALDEFDEHSGEEYLHFLCNLAEAIFVAPDIEFNSTSTLVSQEKAATLNLIRSILR